MDSQYYRDTLVHLYQKYPITGGREDLYPLVALYMIDLEENGIHLDADDSNDSDDDNDDGDNGDGDNGDQDEDDKKNTNTQNKRQHSGDIIMNFSIKIKRYK
jgi:catechol-2,3-dioxygenase